MSAKGHGAVAALMGALAMLMMVFNQTGDAAIVALVGILNAILAQGK